MKKRLFAFVFAAAAAVCGNALALETSDFGHPESIALDPATGAYFVSNINGAPTEKDSNGFISKISPDGLVTVLKFIDAKGKDYDLHAPKGLAVLNGVLYAVDIGGVKAFDTETGKFKWFYDFATVIPVFLNDIAADRNGMLFVSDMMANRIYRFDPGKPDALVEVFKDSPLLAQPNGLLFNRQTRGLMVVSWAEGRLMEIDLNGHIKVLRKDLGNLDGIAIDAQGNLYLSNYPKGEIYLIAKWGRGALSLFGSGLDSPADISYDDARGELLVPLMNQNRVTSLKGPEVLTNIRTKVPKSARKGAVKPARNIV